MSEESLESEVIVSIEANDPIVNRTEQVIPESKGEDTDQAVDQNASSTQDTEKDEFPTDLKASSSEIKKEVEASALGEESLESEVIVSIEVDDPIVNRTEQVIPESKGEDTDQAVDQNASSSEIKKEVEDSTIGEGSLKSEVIVSSEADDPTESITERVNFESQDENIDRAADKNASSSQHTEEDEFPSDLKTSSSEIKEEVEASATGEESLKSDVIVNSEDDPIESATEQIIRESQGANTDQTEEEGHETEKAEEINYSALSKEQLLEALVELVRKDDVIAIIKSLNDIKKFFDRIENNEREAAHEKFIAESGEKDGFKFQIDEISQKFLANYQVLRDRRQKHYKELERQKDENLKIKNQILEELREIVDSEETTTSIKVINEIRNKWRNTGPIPRQFNRTLWANYNALMDRFYDNRSIYFELKELDRKKNLEIKTELCGKAETLATNEDLKKAIMELNSLHDDFKHIGPVPKENQEEIWLRFKAASDSIYSKRKIYIDEIKDQLQENLQEKLALCDQIEPFTGFSSDRITEWNSTTKKVQELQKKWEKIGGLPRDKSKVVNRRFWSAFKTFFANKSKFFKTLDGQKEGNLKLKEDLVNNAEDLKTRDDFIKTAELFKKLQLEWREIGPVPDKVKNKIYKKFKAACDEFFDRKRASVKESEKEFVENLKRKEELCNQLEEISNSDKIDLDMVEALQTQYSGIGFVPRSDLKSMNKRYDEVLNMLKGKLDESELSNKEQLALEIEIRKMKGKPGANKQIQKQGHNLRRQITTMENDISTWENNLEFFSASKTADKLKKDFDMKIDAANEELKQLKKQLRLMEGVFE